MPVETLDGMPTPAGLLTAVARTARGRRGETVPDRTLRVDGIRVDRHRLAEYQRLTGYDVGDTLPQTYPWVLAFPLQTALMARPDFPLPLLGLVHLGNRLRTHRAVDADEPLSLEVTAGGLRPHRRGRTVDVRLEAHVRDELVWESESIYLSRGQGDEEAPRGESPPDLPPGPPLARWRLPEDLGRRYAAVSGDVNPIHLHPLTARAFGFPRHIVHGMWSYARILAALGRASLGPSSSRVWFTANIPLPSTVELVSARSEGSVLAGLRSARDPERPLVILTLDT